MVDTETLIGVGVTVLGVGGGIGLIAFTENAGKREAANSQTCVDCRGEKVITCTLCKGTGVDPFASLVAGVKEMSGDVSGSGDKILIDDWESGTKEVVMYEEILSQFPVKAAESICATCGGRGVVVCDSCQGSGIQPRFLERYSPDDFMD